ncbi:hypothetical protein PC119_g21760 [Phytophthora cactorum]|nr:hypothetical protein PC119_g21760 [Phytophthora cactorum]
MYADNSLNVTDKLLEHVAAQGIVLAVDQLKDHKWNGAINDFELQVDQAADEQLTEYWRKVQKDCGLGAVEQPIAEPADPVAGEPGTPEDETPSTERR